MAQITGNFNHEKLNDFKRLYLPGLEIKDTCNHCQKDVVISLSEHYPYNFKSDGSCTLSYLCPHCEEAKNLDIKMDLKLSVVK